MSDPSHLRVHRIRATADGAAGPFNLQMGRHHRLLVYCEKIQRLRTEALRFAHDSAILAPLDEGGLPTVALATALLRLSEAEDARLLVLGHASATGSTSRNEAVALHRARCVAALIRGDGDAWVELMTEAGGPADVQRWLLHLAGAHGWPTNPGRTDGVLDEQAQDAMRHFQHTFNQQYGEEIDAHGKITGTTLSALFQVLHDELVLVVQLRAGEEVDIEALSERLEDDYVIGCGSEFASSPRFDEAATEEGARRADLFLLPADCDWEPGIGVHELLDTYCVELLEYDPRVRAPRDLTVRLVDHYGRPLAGEAYVLDDGGTERRGSTDEQGMLVERGVEGARLVLSLEDQSTIVFDEVFSQVAMERHRPSPAPDEDDDDEPSDEPLPALLEDDDVDEDSEVSDLEAEAMDDVDHE